MSFTPTGQDTRTGDRNFWSAIRYNGNNAWYANGNTGYFNNNDMYNLLWVLPVSNYEQSQHKADEAMIELQDIIDAYLVARANKRRTADQTDFELHWEMNCVRLYRYIVSRRLRPTAYAFVTMTPRPREVFASDMATRVLHHYLDMRLRPLLEERLSPHTFNNRIGKGQKACQNAVITDIYDMSEGFTRDDTHVIKVDLKGCFPNIRQDIAYGQLREVIEQGYHGRDKDELLYILQVCVFSYPTEHCERLTPERWSLIPPEKSLFTKPPGTGAAIGFLIWQVAVNWYFHDIDEWLSSIGGIRFERFVDDIYIVTNSKAMTLALLPELRRRLAALGAELNERKTYCQHYTKGLECLGTHIKMDRIYVNRRIVQRGIRKARSFRKASERGIDGVLSSLNSYIGFCKQMNGYTQAWRIWEALPSCWRKYLHFDTTRVAIVPNPGYSRRERIVRNHNLIKPKRYGHKRRNAETGGTAA